MMEIKFDQEGAMMYLDKLLEWGEISNELYNIRLRSIYAIAEHEIFFNRNTTNYRVDTNLTNIKKELRNFIRGEFIQIDLTNSQPYLFNYIIRYYNHLYTNVSYCGVMLGEIPLSPAMDKLFRGLKNPPVLNKKEIEKYRILTQGGTIYELFVDSFNISRQDAKKLFLAVMYSPNKSKNYREEKKVFQKEFPTIYKLICKLKSRNYKGLSIALQQLESEIFIDIIARMIIELDIITYTVHDSVIVLKAHKKEVLELMIKVFIQYFNEQPSFKVEDLNPLNLNFDII